MQFVTSEHGQVRVTTREKRKRPEVGRERFRQDLLRPDPPTAEVP